MAYNKYKYALPKGYVLNGGKRNYVIEDTLGKGGFGITYKVKAHVIIDNIPFDLHFAVKEYFPDICSRGSDKAAMIVPEAKHDEVFEGLKDFINEGKRLQEVCKLNHNIVNVSELFEANGTAYYVLEYLEGGDLRKIVRDNGGKGVSEQQMLDIMIPIGKAVQCLHDNRLLHLDIKPDNIVMRLNNQNNSHEPALIDFGIAVHFRSDGTPTSKTPSQGISPGYSPIEQYAQIKKFDSRLDVYAFSATCLFLLTGKDPVEAFSMSSDYVKSIIPQDVSTKTANALERGMSKDNEMRIGTINEILGYFMAAEETTEEPANSLSEESTRNLEPPIAVEAQELVANTIPSKGENEKEKGNKDLSTSKKSLSKNILIPVVIVAALALLAGLAIWGIKGCTIGESNQVSDSVSSSIANEEVDPGIPISAEVPDVAVEDIHELQNSSIVESQQLPPTTDESLKNEPQSPIATKTESPMKVPEQPKKDTKPQKETITQTETSKSKGENNPQTTPTNSQKSAEEKNNSNTSSNNQNGTNGKPSISGLDGYTLSFFPTAPCPGPGTVVVRVTVGSTGQVTRATVIGGSLKGNARACEICRGLALKSRFSVPMNTTLERTGTLTYTIK